VSAPAIPAKGIARPFVPRCPWCACELERVAGGSPQIEQYRCQLCQVSVVRLHFGAGTPPPAMAQNA